MQKATNFSGSQHDGGELRAVAPLGDEAERERLHEDVAEQRRQPVAPGSSRAYDARLRVRLHNQTFLVLQNNQNQNRHVSVDEQSMTNGVSVQSTI